MYKGAILAPMVRIGTLPTRLLCLEEGADLVYTEEIIDHRLMDCRKFEHENGLVEFKLTAGTHLPKTKTINKFVQNRRQPSPADLCDGERKGYFAVGHGRSGPSGQSGQALSRPHFWC